MKNVKLSFAICLFIAASVFGGSSLRAAESVATASSTEDSTEVLVDTDRLRTLVETLESDTARAELLSNLKLLLEEQEKATSEEEELKALSEQVGLRPTLDRAIKAYEDFLDRHALSSSLVQKIFGSCILFSFMLILLLGVKNMAVRLVQAVDHLSKKIGIRLSRFTLYTKTLQWILRILILGTSLYTLAKIWHMRELSNFFEGDHMRSFLSMTLTTIFLAFIVAVIWEGVGIYLSYILKQADDNNQSRIKTLLPLIQNVTMIIFAILFGLVMLSELGINVTPLIAGAGVIGVAIGFGAQSMVKDFLTGFTIVLEDLVRVGDVVTLGGCTGVVERITLRKIQLRDFAGIVYTLPFSEITTIQNLTKDFSFYVMEVNISYAEDADRVVSVLEKIDEDMRQDENFMNFILAPLEVVGIDRFADSAVIIKARIKTNPGKQWSVGREFNRRMKRAFDREGIEIPFPQRTVTVRNETGGPLPPAVFNTD